MLDAEGRVITGDRQQSMPAADSPLNGIRPYRRNSTCAPAGSPAH